MKKTLIILLFISIGIKVLCQNDSCYRFRVEYEMQLNFSEPILYNSSLCFNKSLSLFEYKENGLESDGLENAKYGEQNVKINLRKKLQFYISSNKEKNELLELVGGFKSNEFFQLEEPIPIINWIITQEVKKINKHNCIKASCSFRGRNYTVWFTTDLQTNFGPLKLNGLPGLILELSDDTKEVTLYAKVIKQEDRRIASIQPGLRKISRSEYKEMISEGMKDIEMTAKAVTSRMERGMQASFKISTPKSIEMDYFQ